MKLSDWLLDWRKRTEMVEELRELEVELQEILTPVEPRHQFVKTLRQNLMKQLPGVEPIPYQPQHQAFQTGLLVTGGILGSVIIVLTGVRGLISLVGAVGLVISWLRQNSQDSLTESNLAR